MKIWVAEEFNRAHARALEAERRLADAAAKAATTTWVSQRVAECTAGLAMPGDLARLLEARIEKVLREALGVGL